MQKKPAASTPKSFSKQIWNFISILIILSGTFIVCQPKINAYLFPFIREKRQIQFIANQNETLDLNQYYQFREFSGGFGHWTFDDDQLDMTALFVSLPADYQEQSILNLAQFQAPYFQSQTLITDTSTAVTWQAQEASTQAAIIKQGADYTFFQNQDNSITLIFQKSGADFLANQGFFDLSNAPEEKAWLENRVWLEIAHF